MNYFYIVLAMKRHGKIRKMNISKETITELQKEFRIIFYDNNVNQVPFANASELRIVSDITGETYIGKSVKATKRETTIKDIYDKLSLDTVYVNFSNDFNKIIKSFGLNSYPTTYGIGIFVAFGFRKNIEENKFKAAEALSELGIEFTTETSEAGWVFRYKISKSAKNIEKIKALKK